MRRADRLFQIVQLLRRGRVTTARELARALEVSVRTIYRDIEDLVLSGVPIQSEAGIGYLLQNYDLPPLMFSRNEIEALALGLRIVESWGDPHLAESARAALARVEAALPDDASELIKSTPLYAPPDHFRAVVAIDMPALRDACRMRRKVRIHYRDAGDRPTERTVWPLALWFYGPVWVLPAWCELREDFRAFRLDRMTGMNVLEDDFDPNRPDIADAMLRLINDMA